MRVRAGAATRAGRAVDLGPTGVGRSFDPDAVIAAVRQGGERGSGSGPDDLRIDCPSPSPPHRKLGRIGPAKPLRPVLAAAARSRGRTAPQHPACEAIREELADLEVPSVDLEAARRRVADAGEAEDRLRERMASLRGRKRVLAERDAALDDVESELAAVASRLSETETERVAAEQALERAESAAREARAVRERRLRLQDRLDNRLRDARAALADGIYGEFADDVATLPGEATAGSAPGAFAGDPVIAHFGAVAVADLDAPVVIPRGARRFGGASEAATRLGVPVVRL